MGRVTRVNFSHHAIVTIYDADALSAQHLKEAIRDLCLHPALGKSLKLQPSGLKAYRVGPFRIFHRIKRHAMDVLFLDPKTGSSVDQLKSVKPGKNAGSIETVQPNMASASFSPGRVFVSNDSNLAAYRLKDNYVQWRQSLVGTLALAPLATGAPRAGGASATVGT